MGKLITMPMADYLDQPQYSRSFLWTLLTKTPRHAQYMRTHPRTATEPQRLGTPIHTKLLEPDLFDESVVIHDEDNFNLRRPDDRQALADYLEIDPGYLPPSGPTKKSIYEAFALQYPGKSIISSFEARQIADIVASVRSKECAADLLSEGQAEGSAFFLDESGEIPLKARPDWVTPPEKGIVVDLKSAESASPGQFRNSVDRYGYYMQGVFYLDAVNRALDTDAYTRFVFIVVEKEPPYGCAIYELDEDQLELGRRDIDDAIGILKGCKGSRVWPSYPDRIVPLSPPAWRLKELREIEDPLAEEEQVVPKSTGVTMGGEPLF